jgi:hypothetical protein
MKQTQNFAVVNVNTNVLPIISEDTKTRYPYIPFGVYGHDDFFDAVDTAFNVSTTNAACIGSIADLIYGKGLYTKNDGIKDALAKTLPQEEIKRVAFDLKLYGNAAFQVYWNDEHTQIIKMYHIPVRTLRAEKLYGEPKVQNYFYCTDWNDQRKVKEKKKIPAFETSEEKMEILYIKNYFPGLYYYSLPDWVPAMQFCLSEGEISNLHINNIMNGFLPAVMINFNNGIPAPEERETIEDLVQAKFTGTDNAGRFMLSFNDDPANKPTIDAIQIDNLHEKYSYVAEYAQDRILVAHRVISPLLFGINTKNKGFSSNADEMNVAYSILQTMTIAPFQNLLINSLDYALKCGGWEDTQLYFEQLLPLALLATSAKDSGQTVEQVADSTNKELENPAATEDEAQATTQEANKPIGDNTQPAVNVQDKKHISTSAASFKKEYEIFNQQ